MVYIKSFLLGMGVAYGIYYLTKKREDGTSLMDEVIDNPGEFIDKAKDFAIDEAVEAGKKILK